jgi:pyruvate dehydrogenase complex dehydrogenase (E1) component
MRSFYTNIFATSILILAVTVHAIASQEYKFIVHSSQEKELVQLVREAMPTSVLIDNITYTSDVILPAAEFFYLVDIPQQSIVTQDQIIQSIFYLLRKNKVEKIIVSFQRAVAGYTLHFDLISYWT